MYGRLEWVECDGGGGACSWMVRREGKERSRSGLCGHGWCVWEGWRKEGGREGEGGEEATDSVEPQNSHKKSFFSGLARHFHRIRKSFDTLPLVQTLSRHLSCASELLPSSAPPSHVSLGGRRDSWN